MSVFLLRLLKKKLEILYEYCMLPLRKKLRTEEVKLNLSAWIYVFICFCYVLHTLDCSWNVILVVIYFLFTYLCIWNPRALLVTIYDLWLLNRSTLRLYHSVWSRKKNKIREHSSSIIYESTFHFICCK